MSPPVCVTESRDRTKPGMGQTISWNYSPLVLTKTHYVDNFIISPEIVSDPNFAGNVSVEL